MHLIFLRETASLGPLLMRRPKLQHVQLARNSGPAARNEPVGRFSEEKYRLPLPRIEMLLLTRAAIRLYDYNA